MLKCFPSRQKPRETGKRGESEREEEKGRKRTEERKRKGGKRMLAEDQWKRAKGERKGRGKAKGDKR